jgi:uncharacterized membrane protein
MNLFFRWLHVLAAVIWLGGMLFITLVLVPVLRRIGDSALRSELLGQVGRRFRSVAWVALGLLLASGVANLLARPWYLKSAAFQVKLALVVLALILSVLHDFVLGPRANRSSAQGPRRRVSVIARVNALVVLAIVLLGLALRG